MSHLTARTKKKPARRLVPCPQCGGERVARDVDVTQRDGRVTPGIAIVRVDCETCNSTGLVRAGLAPACCCSGPAADRCDGCRNARRGGSEIHVCGVASEETRRAARQRRMRRGGWTCRRDRGCGDDRKTKD